MIQTAPATTVPLIEQNDDLDIELDNVDLDLELDNDDLIGSDREAT